MTRKKFRLEKSALSVAPLGDARDDKAFWLSKTPLERLDCCARHSVATIRLPIEFKEFLKLLNSNKVEYLLVGESLV